MAVLPHLTGRGVGCILILEGYPGLTKIVTFASRGYMVNVEVKSKLKFHKSLAKYYYKWLKDSYQSYKHCEDNGKMESARASIGIIVRHT